MRWTRRCRQTNDIGADGEVVWSWRPLAGAKLATMLRIAPMTVIKTSRTPGRSRRKPYNHRAGNAGSFRRTCGDYARVHLPFARETAGATRARHSLRPLGAMQSIVANFEGHRSSKARAQSACENADLCPFAV